VVEQTMTERQKREMEFYEEYYRRNTPSTVNFDPIEGKEKRPWNSYWRFIEIVQQDFKSEEQRLLDFGCGTGMYSVIFAKIGYQVFGFDIAPNNIAIASSLSEKYGLQDRTNFSVSVAETLDYPDEYFDVVTGINILHHVDIKNSLTECMRVLKPGGIAMFHEPVRAPLFDIVRESKLGTRLVSKEASIERQITQDERKLNNEDLAIIKNFGSECTFERFLLLSRLDRFIREGRRGPSLLEQVDFHLIRWIPFVRVFGGECLIKLRK
jgi:2-polyprenyl-3-methyl-5-hydroxy-6-metoxy-1,4-benzoquinol methylase